MPRNEIAPGVYITDVPGRKFKRNLVVFHLLLPGQRQTANEMALLPHVLERRCEAIPDPLLLSRKLFDLYGAELSLESFAAGPNRVLTLAVSCLKNGYALAGEDLEKECVELLCNLLFFPKKSGGVFEAEDVAIEREKQVDYLRSEMNDKRSYCLRQGRRALYGGTQLGIESAGYLEEMPKVTAESLYEAYETMLRTARFEVVTCGADKDKVAELLAARLSNRQRAPVEPLGRMAVPQRQGMIHKSEGMDTAQGKLCIIACSGRVSDAHSEAVMRVANAVLGGLPTSRLFVNVREKQSLCYYCASSYASLRGTLTMDSGVDHKNAKRAAEAMLHELEVLQKNPVTQEELDAAHSAIQNAFQAAKDSPDSLVSWAFNERLRGTDLTLEQAAQKVKAVEAEEVQKALADFIPSIEYILTNKEGL
ncbi:insulinase family protein [Ruminococcaceae bacterium OttesenSCG-928-I18]|nr:insulinase family protein [Ruminococcaceae bacterium OttesenSCG-928-I18]